MIDKSRWKEFHLYDIFDIDMGNKMDKGKISDGNIAFVGRTANNNGINAHVGRVVAHEKYGTVVPYKTGCITLALGGSIGSCFIQEEPFYTSQNVAVLMPKTKQSEYALKFITSVITNSVLYGQYKAFTEELNKHIKTDFVINLPATPDGQPDWNYMESYMKKIMDEAEKNFDNLKKNDDAKHLIDTNVWREFCVGKLFSCETAFGVLAKNDLEDGDINYITRSATDNGFSGTCGNENRKNKGNCITIGAEGFVAFWQTDDFVAGNKVYVLRHPKMNELSGLLVCSALNALSDRYSFADARVLDKIKVEVIKLPITSTGDPDWDYMESYMKKIMDESENIVSNLQMTN